MDYSKVKAFPKQKQNKLDQGYATRKREADKAFAKYIRLRETFRYAKSHGLSLINGSPAVQCCTCSSVIPAINSIHNGNPCHAGHYIQRDRVLTRFHEQNVHVQCQSCNTYQSGMQSLHGKYIDKTYGRRTSDKLDALGLKSKRNAKMDVLILLQIEETAKKNCKALVEYLVKLGTPPEVFK